MPLHLEVYNQQLENWYEVGIVWPHDAPGEILNVYPNGRWELYVYRCLPDDSRSILYRKRGRGLIDRNLIIAGQANANLEVAVELRPAESYEIRIVSYPPSIPLRRIRFIHR